MFLASFNSSFDHINFLPSEASSISVFFRYHPYFLNWVYTFLFFPLYPREDPCSAKPAFCLTWLTSNRWEFPVPVPIKGDVWKVISTAKTFSQGPLLTVKPEKPEVSAFLLSVQSWGFARIFSPVNRDFELDCFVITVPKMSTIFHFAHEILSVDKHQIKSRLSRSSQGILICVQIHKVKLRLTLYHHTQYRTDLICAKSESNIPIRHFLISRLRYFCMGYSVVKVEGTISVKPVLDLFPPGRILFMQDNAVISVAFNVSDFLLNRWKYPEIKNFTCVNAVEIG